MYINQQDAQNSVVRLYFLLDSLHVSDSVSPSSGATFYKLYIAFGICRYMPIRLAGYNHTTARRMVLAYTKCDVRLVLTESGRTSNRK